MRRWMTLVEATLYRGDATRIEQFDSAKTGFLALFGPGIYLTDDPTVAADYTLKASDHVLVRGDSDQAVIMLYLAMLVRDHFNWKEVRQDLLSKWQQLLYADPEYVAATGRPFQYDKAQAIIKRYEAAMTADRMQQLSKLLRKAKVIFKRQAADLRLIQDTTGEWALVKKDRDAYVSRFDIPDDYLARTFNADRPLPDAALHTIRELWLAGRPATTVFDMRDADGKFMTFDGWVHAYHTKGILYAWASKDEGRDPVMRGTGNPTFDMIRNGTHFGTWFMQADNMARFIAAMQTLGYVGMEYDGGVRLGSHLRGGGGNRHRAFVLWNDADVNRFRVNVTKVSAQDAEIETKIANSVRAASLLYSLGQISNG